MSESGKELGSERAFPWGEHNCGGLSKRELFAAMAIHGLISQSDYWEDHPDKATASALKMADALLEELAKGGS